jgi:hypothetical protein
MGGAADDDHGACSDTEPPARTEIVRELSWSRIALPASVAASSLATASEALLVGGRASSDRARPVLLTVDPSGLVHSARLHPTMPGPISRPPDADLSEPS